MQRYAKCIINGQVQIWNVYTKTEFLEQFGLSIPLTVPHPIRDGAISATKKTLGVEVSDENILAILKSHLDCLGAAIPEKDYLHLDVRNIAKVLYDLKAAFAMLSNQMYDQILSVHYRKIDIKSVEPQIPMPEQMQTINHILKNAAMLNLLIIDPIALSMRIEDTIEIMLAHDIPIGCIKWLELFPNELLQKVIDRRTK